MPKKRRLLNPSPQKQRIKLEDEQQTKVDNLKRVVDGDMWMARGRLKGALMEVLEPTAEDSDESSQFSPNKRYRDSTESGDYENSDAGGGERHRSGSPPRQPYVLKLFDRSVDLSQFKEHSPLYPVCRAWMLNQPKANYRQLSKIEKIPDEGCMELPGPEGPPVPRIPPLLPEQAARNKDNINLNYKECPPVCREVLLGEHSRRWAAVREAWRAHSALVEERYSATRDLIQDMRIS